MPPQKSIPFLHFNNVGGQHVGTPNMDPKRGLISGCKDLTIRGFIPTGAHGLSVLNNSPQILRATGEPNFVKFSLTLIQGKRTFPRGSPVNHHNQIVIPPVNPTRTRRLGRITPYAHNRGATRTHGGTQG